MVDCQAARRVQKSVLVGREERDLLRPDKMREDIRWQDVCMDSRVCALWTGPQIRLDDEFCISYDVFEFEVSFKLWMRLQQLVALS